MRCIRNVEERRDTRRWLRHVPGYPARQRGSRPFVSDDHAASLAELPDESGARVFRTAQKVAAALYASDLGCEGINLFLADGEAAGQEVFHIDLHVVPRFEEDGFSLTFGPDCANRVDREGLDKTAKRIRDAL